MKKFISMLIVLALLLTFPVAFAGNMDVQVIGGNDAGSVPVSLDDIQLNTEIEIDGYAVILPNEFAFEDCIGHYDEGKTFVNDFLINREWLYQSGQDADYAILRMDITNISKKPIDFLTDCEVKMIFDDEYEYIGWFYQVNYNNETLDYDRYENEAGKQNFRWAINEADNFAIDPMYAGHYIFGCTVPNAVVNSKAPLRMVITLDGNEMTYNIRK